MAEKEETVSKVFVLPTELVERINEYRQEQGLDSEVEAVRRLLDGALMHRDTTNSLLIKLLARFKTEKDLRILARDILATHPKVETIAYQPGMVSFEVKDDFRGIIDQFGKVFISGPDNRWVQLYLDKNGVLSAEEDDTIHF